MTSEIKFLLREHCSLDTAGGTKKLWAAVRRIAGGREKKDEPNITAENLNTYCAPSQRTQRTRRLTARPDVQLLIEPIIFGILDHLRPTAAGLDLIPAWYLRVLAPACSGWLARIYSLSLYCSWVPTQWEKAVIHPCRKLDCFRLPSHLSCLDPLADPGANSRDQLHLSGYICSSNGQSGC